MSNRVKMLGARKALVDLEFSNMVWGTVRPHVK